MLHGSMDTGNVTDRRPPAEVTLQEITRALIEHPAVAEVSVVPCQQPDGGRRQVAFVVPQGAPCPEEELQRHVNERLGSGVKLRKVVFMDALPRSATGKVDRRRLETGEFNDCPPPPA